MLLQEIRQGGWIFDPATESDWSSTFGANFIGSVDGVGAVSLQLQGQGSVEPRQGRIEFWTKCSCRPKKGYYGLTTYRFSSRF